MEAVTVTFDCGCGARVHAPDPLHDPGWRQPLWDHILDAHRGAEETYSVFTSRGGVRLDLLAALVEAESASADQ